MYVCEGVVILILEFQRAPHEGTGEWEAEARGGWTSTNFLPHARDNAKERISRWTSF